MYQLAIKDQCENFPKETYEIQPVTLVNIFAMGNLLKQ